MQPFTKTRPEDTELSRKRSELAALQVRLAELQLYLLNMRVELNEFEAFYHGKVGPLYAELDELEAQIAERLAKSRPLDREAADSASRARRRADASRLAANVSLTMPSPAVRSQRLRELYRAAAKQLHPDLAQDEHDRHIRERLMTEANLAYAKGDEARLEAILEEYQSSPDTVVGSDIGAELVRTIRRISLAQLNIGKGDAEIGHVKASELFKLKSTVDEGDRSGDDVLGDLAKNLRNRIDSRRKHLQTL
jgi:hypothetical protein